MRGGIKIAMCGMFFALATPLEAKVLRLTCTDATTKTRYDFAYDTARQRLTSTHKDFTDRIDVEKTQEDEDGLLVWGTMPQRPSAKNILLHFGKEKWAMHFWGYDDKRKDPCV